MITFRYFKTFFVINTHKIDSLPCESLNVYFQIFPVYTGSYIAFFKSSYPFKALFPHYSPIYSYTGGRGDPSFTCSSHHSHTSGSHHQFFLPTEILPPTFRSLDNRASLWATAVCSLTDFTALICSFKIKLVCPVTCAFSYNLLSFKEATQFKVVTVWVLVQWGHQPLFPHHFSCFLSYSFPHRW